MPTPTSSATKIATTIAPAFAIASVSATRVPMNRGEFAIQIVSPIARKVTTEVVTFTHKGIWIFGFGVFSTIVSFDKGLVGLGLRQSLSAPRRTAQHRTSYQEVLK